MNTAEHLLATVWGRKFHTVLADPPWQFQNRTGKMAPEHGRLHRYATMSLSEIAALPVAEIVNEPAHLYLWVPNALLPEGWRSCGPGASSTRRCWSGSRRARRRAGRSRRRVLLPQRHRVGAVRRPGQGRPHRACRPETGQLHRFPQAGAQPQA